MKKIIGILMSVLITTQAFAQPWHGHKNHYRANPSYHGGYVNHHNYDHYNRNYRSRGEWRHTNHNGQLAWWFVVGSMFYLSEQAYLNNRNYNSVILTPQPVYNPPVYVQESTTVYTTPSYRASYGWYCEPLGRFSSGSYDTCPNPWVSKEY